MRQFAWLLPILALGLAATPALSQERVSKRVGGPAPEIGKPSVSGGLGYVAWLTDFDFEVRTATLAVENKAPGIQGVELFGLWEFEDGWSARLGIEASFGLEMDTLGVTIGMLWDTGLLKEPWDAYARAAVLWSRLEMDGVPGDFEPGLGLEGGFGVTCALPSVSEGLALQAEVGMRWLAYEFDGDDGILSADDEVGGFGVRFLIGIDHRF